MIPASRSGRAALPFLVAAGAAGSWAEVLQAYQTTARHLQGIYAPTPAELKAGLAKMPTSWSTSLFYYTVVKPACDGEGRRPDQAVVAQALLQFKHAGNLSAMRQLFAEDVNTSTLQGAQATLVLAAYTGMWEQALHVVAQHPRLKDSPSNRRTLVNTLSAAGQVERALALLQDGSGVEMSPNMIRPIVKRLSLERRHAAALRLSASSFAAGYSINASLFAALIQSARETGQPRAALDTALAMGLFSMHRAEAQKRIALFNRLVDCLYDMDPYAAEYTVDAVVQEMLSRMSPREVLFRPTQRRKQFRLHTVGDVLRRFEAYALPLSHLYTRCINITRWYAKPLSGLADLADEAGSVVLVLDTNFLLQCVSKNLPMEYFYANMGRQFPSVEGHLSAPIVVIPFTTIQEAYTIVWSQSNRLRHSVRVLLWSRVVAFTRQPSVHVLSLATEVPTMSLSILTRMAHAKTSGSGVAASGVESVAAPPVVADASTQASDAGGYYRNPDARVLNVCLFLHHAFRSKRVAAAQGVSVPEGTNLFALLKYHVRRYTGTVKGSGCDSVLLCTMDKELSRVAREAGVNCFPILK